MDIELAKAGLHMMIEKPISMRPVEEVERLAQVFAYLSIAHVGCNTKPESNVCICMHAYALAAHLYSLSHQRYLNFTIIMTTKLCLSQPQMHMIFIESAKCNMPACAGDSRVCLLHFADTKLFYRHWIKLLRRRN